MLTAQELARLVAFCLEAHAGQATRPSRAVRRWDGVTPYGVHPAWCALTLLTETTLPEPLRVAGARALLLHDVLEDTTAALPEDTPAEVAELVRGMTFASSSEEMRLVWDRPPEIRLLKLYDKVSNLLDGAWMPAEKRSNYAAYLLRLCGDVEPRYGRLNIVCMARAVASSPAP